MMVTESRLKAMAGKRCPTFRQLRELYSDLGRSMVKRIPLPEWHPDYPCTVCADKAFHRMTWTRGEQESRTLPIEWLFCRSCGTGDTDPEAVS